MIKTYDAVYIIDPFSEHLTYKEYQRLMDQDRFVDFENLDEDEDYRFHIKQLMILTDRYPFPEANFYIKRIIDSNLVVLACQNELERIKKDKIKDINKKLTEEEKKILDSIEK